MTTYFENPIIGLYVLYVINTCGHPKKWGKDWLGLFPYFFWFIAHWVFGDMTLCVLVSLG